MDAFVAATAIARGFALVTRNEHDFRDLGLKIVNPWRR
jgi:predicted nucleic acid-binding protein